MSVHDIMNNVIQRFETCVSVSSAQDAVRNRLIAPGICFSQERIALRTPHADSDGRTIWVHEAYLNFLWCIIYALLTIEEEGLRKPLLAKTFTGSVDFINPLLQAANLSFQWALSLRHHFSSWPTYLPRPHDAGMTDPGDYVGKANAVFIEAMTLALCHEYSHLVHKQIEIIKEITNKPVKERTPAEVSTLLSIEREADNFALGSLINFQDEDSKKHVSALSSLLMYCANLLLLETPYLVAQEIHPDLDQRLDNVIRVSGIQDDARNESLKLTACFACRKFFDLHQITIAEPSTPTVDQLYDYYMAVFDHIKEIARSEIRQ
jgi:hypothetical protein